MANLQPAPPGVVLPEAAGMPAQMKILLRSCLQPSDMLYANVALGCRLCIPGMKLSSMQISDMLSQHGMQVPMAGLALMLLIKRLQNSVTSLTQDPAELATK